jgi:hypothetical protein
VGGTSGGRACGPWLHRACPLGRHARHGWQAALLKSPELRPRTALTPNARGELTAKTPGVLAVSSTTMLGQDMVLRYRYAKISADFLCQLVTDFRVPGDSRPAIGSRIAPPGMFSPFADQVASVGAKMSKEAPPSHT